MAAGWGSIDWLALAGLRSGARTAVSPQRLASAVQSTRDNAARADLDAIATAAPPGASLAVSPAWLAFRRSLGIEDTTDAATTQAQIDALNRRAGLTRGDLIEQGARAREGIGGNFEARGVYRSGARLQAQARQQSDEARALSDIEAGLAGQVSTLAGGLAQRQAERQRRLAEAGLSTAFGEATGGGY